MSEGSNCKWCSLALDIEDWVYSQLENNSHLLRGVTRLIRRKRTATIKFLKTDLADLVSNGLDANTYSRAGGLLDELRHLWNLDFIEQTCDFVYRQLSTMQKMGLQLWLRSRDLKGALRLLELPRFLSVGELNFECSLMYGFCILHDHQARLQAPFGIQKWNLWHILLLLTVLRLGGSPRGFS